MQSTAPAIVVNSEVVARTVGDEAILLDLSTGTYFTLNAVGTVVWRGLEAGHSVDEIVAAVLSEFDAAESVVREDVHALLHDLASNGLVCAA